MAVTGKGRSLNSTWLTSTWQLYAGPEVDQRSLWQDWWGTPFDQVATPAGIPSAEAHGAAVGVGTQVVNLTGLGIPSAEAHGTITAFNRLQIATPAGIPSAEAHGAKYDVTWTEAHAAAGNPTFTFPEDTQVGDLGVLLVGCYKTTGSAITTPSGWTQRQSISSTSYQRRLFTKTITQDDLNAGGVTVTSTNSIIQGILTRIPGGTYDTSGVSAVSDTTVTGFTPANDNEVLLYFAHDSRLGVYAPTVSDWALATNDRGFVEVTEQHYDDGANSATTAVAVQYQASKLATGNWTVTMGTGALSEEGFALAAQFVARGMRVLPQQFATPTGIVSQEVHGYNGTRTLSFSQAYGEDSVDFDLPAPATMQAGDLLALLFAMRATGAASFTPPNGFTEQESAGTTYLYCRLFTKTASEADVQAGAFPMVWASGSNEPASAMVVAIRGATYDTSGFEAGVGSPRTIAALTQAAADSFLLFFGAGSNGSTTTPEWNSWAVADSNPTWTERFDGYHYDGTDGVAAALATADRAPATSTGNWTVSLTNVSRSSAVALIASPSATSLKTIQIIKPTGIASAEAHGQAVAVTAGQVAEPAGIASAEAMGTPTRSATYTAAPAGIASSEAHGAVTVLATATRTCSGIPSAEAHGTPTAAATYSATPTGVPTGELHGTPTVVKGAVTRTPTGIASAEAHGSVTVLKGAVTRTPAGIPSGEAHGATQTALGAVARTCTGIASQEAMGAAIAVSTATRSTTGIPTGEAHGTPTTSATVTRTPAGIASGELHGTPTAYQAAGVQTRTPTGIASAEAHGSVTWTTSTTRSLTGVSSSEAHGTPTWTVGAVTRTPTGIASAQAMGTPTRVAGPVTRTTAGIPSSEAMGAVSTRASITRACTGIVSGQAMGSATATPGPVTRTLAGIASAEAHGTPTVALGWQYIFPAGIPSEEAHGTPRALGGNITLSYTVVGSRWTLEATAGRWRLDGLEHRRRVKDLAGHWTIESAAGRWETRERP